VFRFLAARLLQAIATEREWIMLELELIGVKKQFILVKLLKLKGRNERRRRRRWYVWKCVRRYVRKCV